MTLAEIFDALARVERDGGRRWTFDCCVAIWEPGMEHPMILRDSNHSAGYYNASMIALPGSDGTRLPLWNTGNDKMKRAVLEGLKAWTVEKMPRRAQAS